MESTDMLRDRRKQLLRDIERLSRLAIFGTLSETYRACGTASCRCHDKGPKHGPYLTVSYRSQDGKTTGYSVPRGAETSIREGIEAWRELQQCLREMGEINKDHVLQIARAARERST